MEEKSDDLQSQQGADQHVEQQVARRGLLVKGAAAAVPISAGVFVPPRLTSLNLRAGVAAAAPALSEG